MVCEEFYKRGWIILKKVKYTDDNQIIVPRKEIVKYLTKQDILINRFK